MRYLIPFFCLCGCVSGYAQESTEAPEEVVIVEVEESKEVAVDSQSSEEEIVKSEEDCGKPQY
ncbi:MAG: hypothetical protein COT85_00545 [Chlamydiae bacterium CG10_big_fil_rev_8_21_14_0_10_42_34]|nr:MAG: hypothetical protein COT85_00545 [Chlamydiae bacterium CG10_big_fil_rev_8_21_14_0_10_42_34]